MLVLRTLWSQRKGTCQVTKWPGQDGDSREFHDLLRKVQRRKVKLIMTVSCPESRSCHGLGGVALAFKRTKGLWLSPGQVSLESRCPRTGQAFQGSVGFSTCLPLIGQQWEQFSSYENAQKKKSPETQLYNKIPAITQSCEVSCVQANFLKSCWERESWAIEKVVPSLAISWL